MLLLVSYKDQRPLRYEVFLDIWTITCNNREQKIFSHLSREDGTLVQG